MGFLAGWGRRKSKAVDGSTAGDQTNYQLQLTVYKSTGVDTNTQVYLGTNVRDDFGDVRFTDTDGTTLLDYWIQEYTSGVSAVIWIEIPSIPASPGSTTIYIYYDNAAETTTSSGTATFIVFDDFDTDVWTDVGTKAQVSTVNSKLEWNALNGAGDYTSRAQALSTNNFAFRFKYHQTSHSGNFGHAWFGVNVVANDGINATSYGIIVSHHGYGTGKLYFGYVNSGAESWSADSPLIAQEGLDRYIEVTRVGTTTQMKVYSDSSYSTLIHTANKTLPSNYNLQYLLLTNFSRASTVTGWLDSLRVRTFASPEPTFGATGSESGGVSVGWLTA